MLVGTATARVVAPLTCFPPLTHPCSLLVPSAFDAVGAVTTGSAGAGVSAAVWVVATGKVQISATPVATHSHSCPVSSTAATCACACVTKQPGAVHCDPIPVDADIPAAVSAVRGTPLCVVQSNSDGTYSFAGLVPGSYEAVPVFDVSLVAAITHIHVHVQRP